MGIIAGIIAVASAVSAVAGVAGSVANGVQKKSELQIQQEQLDLQKQQYELEKENQALQKEQLEIQKEQLGISQSQLDIQYQELDISKENLQLQKDSFSLQQEQYYEGLTSDYYSYMQNLNEMQGEYDQNQLASNQEFENIASNQFYLDAWANEYDQSMNSAFDEAYGAYQQQASNYASNLAIQGETGAIGSGSSMINVANRLNRKRSAKQMDSYLASTALDMIASRQTASTAVDTGYQAIGSYKDAMATLSTSISSMEATTTGLKNKLEERGITV